MAEVPVLALLGDSGSVGLLLNTADLGESGRVGSGRRGRRGVDAAEAGLLPAIGAPGSGEVGTLSLGLKVARLGSGGGGGDAALKEGFLGSGGPATPALTVPSDLQIVSAASQAR